MEKQMEKFSEKFGVLGTHLKNAQQSYSESDKLFEKAHDTLQGVLGAAPATQRWKMCKARLLFPLK